MTLAAAQGVYDNKFAYWTEKQEQIDDDCIQMIFEAVNESFQLIEEEFAPRETNGNTNDIWEEP